MDNGNSDIIETIYLPSKLPLTEKFFTFVSSYRLITDIRQYFSAKQYVRFIKLAHQLQYNYNAIMTKYKFEWNQNKSDSNRVKHGISFDEAKTVFYDDHGRLIPDPDRLYTRRTFHFTWTEF